MWSVEHGNSLEVLRNMPDNSVDSIVTDPPYGLSKEPDIAEVLTHWLAGDCYVHKSAGFMGKSWDSFVPGPEYWREVCRVLKPGGYVLCFAGTRTQDIMGIALRLGGLECKDSISWHYGSGFPKSLNISKAIDAALGAEREVVGSQKLTGTARIKGGSGYTVEGSADNYETAELRDAVPITASASPEAKAWEGWGTALKPATEPVLVFRKPLEKGLTYAANVLKHGTGALNIDGCRIGMSAEDAKTIANMGGFGKAGYDREPGVALNLSINHMPSLDAEVHTAGRWPANVILSHAQGPCPTCEGEGLTVPEASVPDDLHTLSDAQLRQWFDACSEPCETCSGAGVVGCRQVGVREVKASPPAPSGMDRLNARNAEHGYRPGTYTKGEPDTPADRRNADGTETIPAWECLPGCPVAELDRQSAAGGMHAAGKARDGKDAKVAEVYDATSYCLPANRAMRRFGDQGGASRFFYVAKPSTSEREVGCSLLPKKAAAELTDSPEDSARLNSPRTGAGRSSSGRGNTHATVKPVSLLSYLVRLVTPPGGLVLDPFCGSGTTGMACILEGFHFYGIELEAEHVTIANARCQAAEDGHEISQDPKTGKLKVRPPKAA
jgi:DNA modification methylase